MNADSVFDFDQPIDRRASDSIKWGKYSGRDVIPMWVADLDFASPPAVIDALARRVAHGVFGYGRPSAQVTAAVLEHLQHTYDWTVQPQWIVWLPGLVSGLNITCRSIGRRNDMIVTHIPAYPPFLRAPRLAGRRLLTLPMTNRADGWRFDFDAMESALPAAARAYILCNPHNPTGRVLRPEELARLARICRKNQLIVCADEIHCDLILEAGRRHIPLAALDPGIARQTITLMAPSKTYNIPGLGCSFAVIADDTLRRRFQNTMEGIVPHVNILGLAATEAAYRHGAAWLTALIAYLRSNRDLVVERLNRLAGLHVTPGEATYLAWIDARALGKADPAAFFEAAGVGLMDGTAFGLPGYVRLNFGCRRALLEDAVGRMEAAVRGLQT